MSLNRFLITKANIELTKKFLDGKINKSAAPKYAQKFGSELTVSKGQLIYQGRPLIPKEDTEQFMRDAVYTRGSTVVLNRDAGWASINKLAWGVTRRAWYSFLTSQEKLRSTDRAPPEFKKGGKPARNLFELETDLMEVRTSQMPKELKHIKNSFIIVTVHRVTSLTHLIWIKNKDPETATGALYKQLDWFSKLQKIPVNKYIVTSDAGFEISTPMLKRRGVKHIVQKLGPSAESRIGVVRRHLFKVLNLKRGGFEASLADVNMMLNNMKSKVSGKTPMEANNLSQDDILTKFNAKREKTSGFRKKALAVGSFVRRTLRNKKDIMYKSNSGTQWDPKRYKILGISKKRPYRYRLKITEKIKNKMITHYKWIPGDRLQQIPEQYDQKSAALLKSRLQSGSIRKKPKKPSPPEKAPPHVEVKRKAKAEGIAKRKKAELIEKQKVDFEKLQKRFLQLIKWVDGEALKVYTGPDEVRLEKIYNDNIREGKKLTKQMKKIRKIFKHHTYFESFEF